MAWQYCDNCEAELNPQPDDFLVGVIDCPSCDVQNHIAYAEDTRIEILQQMYRDIKTLKKKAGIE